MDKRTITITVPIVKGSLGEAPHYDINLNDLNACGYIRQPTNKAIMRPSDIRRAVAEWCALGLTVKLEADGAIHITPHSFENKANEFDLLDFKK